MEIAQSSFQKLLLFKMKLDFQDLYIQDCRHGANKDAIKMSAKVTFEIIVPYLTQYQANPVVHT